MSQHYATEGFERISFLGNNIKKDAKSFNKKLDGDKAFAERFYPLFPFDMSAFVLSLNNRLECAQ